MDPPAATSVRTRESAKEGASGSHFTILRWPYYFILDPAAGRRGALVACPIKFKQFEAGCCRLSTCMLLRNEMNSVSYGRL